MIAYIMPMFTIFQDYYAFGVEVYFTRTGGVTWRASDCDELVGEVSRTTECVTDLAKRIGV